VRNITLLLLLACSTELTTFAAHQQGLSAVSLNVTVNTNQFDPSTGFLTGTATDVSSDGQGQYINGQKGVCASVDTQGDLNLNFDCTTFTTPRWLGLIFGTYDSTTNECLPAPPSTDLRAALGPYTNNIVSRQATGQTTNAFQNMTIDASGSTVYYVQLVINAVFSNPSPSYRLNYHWTGTFNDANLASYAQVRRLSFTQWVVESASNPSSSSPNTAMLVSVTSTRHSSTTLECGLYTVPFSFTLDQQ
jgi:hypothetical protein